MKTLHLRNVIAFAFAFTLLIGCVKVDLKPRIKRGSVTDIEGNKYSTVKINDSWWMSENLKTATFNDGNKIQLVTGDAEWNNLDTPGFCWYNNDELNYRSTYGALYNWYTVNTGSLCPDGWHVPTNIEWSSLVSYLGGEDYIAAGKLKEKGTAHWPENWEATNETGFTALPAGFRGSSDGFTTFYNISYSSVSSASWWSSTEINEEDAWHRMMYTGYMQVSGIISSSFSKKYGLSIRCVEDIPPKR